MRKFGMATAAILVTTASGAAVPANWPVTRNAELGFVSSFPTDPKLESKVDDQGVHLATYSAAEPGLVCVVSVADYPAKLDVEGDLVSEREGFLKVVEAQLRSKRRIEIYRGSTAVPAEQFDAAGRSWSTIHAMTIVDGARAYMVAGGAVAGKGRDADVDECLDGFRLLPN